MRHFNTEKLKTVLTTEFVNKFLRSRLDRLKKRPHNGGAVQAEEPMTAHSRKSAKAPLGPLTVRGLFFFNSCSRSRKSIFLVGA